MKFLKKALNILYFVFLCTSLIGCSSSLEPIQYTEEKKAPAPTTKKVEQKKNEEEELIHDPEEDNIMKVLMIGNSFCYYFPDELFGMAQSVGIDMEITNLYYSGCKLDQHWNWYLSNTANYQFITTDENGRTVLDSYTLKKCLNAENWDIISIQQHFGPTTANTYDASYDSCNPYAEKLVNLIKKSHPKAKLYFHETWAYQVGWNRNGVEITDSAMQQLHQKNISAACKQVCLDLNLPMIPSGSAWSIARKHPQIGDVLCNKGPNGDNTIGDFYHDGDTGGGQYLNACVWFEVLTGKSCIGNTWRPDYELNEAKISALQNIAHRAVAELEK